MKLSHLKSIRQSVERGIWIDKIGIAGFEGVRLQVRGLGNADYNRVYSELAEQLKANERDADGKPTDAARDRIVRECLKQAILLGWDGIDDEFSAAKVEEVFADPDLGPVFHNAVIWAASEVASRARAAIEADAKN